jgi:hypothetical protein
MGSAILTFTGAAAAQDSIIGPGFGVGLVVDTSSGGEVAVSPFPLLVLGWDYGVHIKDSADVAVTGRLVVPSSYIAGIKIENSSGVTLDGQYVGGGMQHGVEVMNSSGVSMSDMDFVGNYSGITSGGTSAIECTSSYFVQNTNGCRVLAGATANLGDLSGPLGPGNNRFRENMGYDVANRNAGYWIFADGNAWFWQGHEYCPPLQGRTWGKVRTLCNP